MPKVLANLDTSEYNAIGDYFYYRLNPQDIAKGKFNTCPAVLTQLGYSSRTINFQILWERKRDE